MALPLEGKSALVTGGSRGIGAAIAQRLAEDGANVAVTYARSAGSAEKVVDAIKALGRKAVSIQADAADPEAAAGAVRQAKEALGGLDILVNNAGVFEMGAIGELSNDDFNRTVDVNVRGVFAATNEAARHIADNGRIITTGSVIADRVPFPGASLYAMSKAAVQALSKVWARDLGGRGVTVNTVQPGPIDTEMNPADADFAEPQKQMAALGRFGQAKEVADVVAFLASPEASYVTGASVDVDGGFRI